MAGAVRAPSGSLVNVPALGQLGVGKLRKYDELGRAVVYFGGEGNRILAPKTPIARARSTTLVRMVSDERSPDL